MPEGESIPHYDFAFPISVGDPVDAITMGLGGGLGGGMGGMPGAPSDGCETKYELIETLAAELNAELGTNAPKAIGFEQC